MDEGYLLQFAVSAIAIVALALAAAWARIPRQVPALDEAAARALIADEEPDLAPERVWVDAAGMTAVGRAGDRAVVLFRVGDGFSVRTLPWAEVAGAAAKRGRALIRFDDPGAPFAAFRLAGGEARVPFAEATR